jgi:hypothetical protein
MPRTRTTKNPTPDEIVSLRFAVPSQMARATQSDVYIIMTCTEGAIRIPKSLLKEQNEKYCLFEAKLPRDVAAAFRSVYGELFRLARSLSRSSPMPNSGNP